LIDALTDLKHYQQLITMPNSDTMGLHIREGLTAYAENRSNVFCVESFGSLGYLSCMKHCQLMLGNTSSGFIEAAYFSKPVVNIGCRQRGRIETTNIVTIPIKKADIINAVKKAEEMKLTSNFKIYGDGSAAERIIDILKQI
ncbi:MAG: UDP-N-acetylglucosamine 2-epimerase, partial [bacterium]